MLSDRLTVRCVKIGRYIAENSSTIREAAEKFGMSKSTVHKDVTEKLKNEKPELYERVRNVLDKNKSERHIRGGEATKNKYLRDSINKRRIIYK